MSTNLRVTFTTKQLMETTGLSRRKVQRSRERFDQAVREELAKLAQEEFDRKAVGGRGFGGRRWKPLEPSTIQRKGHETIGIDTGEMVTSLDTSVNNRGIRVGYRAEHSEHFDEKRPLLPAELPKSWEKRLVKAGVKALRSE